MIGEAMIIALEGAPRPDDPTQFVHVPGVHALFPLEQITDIVTLDDDGDYSKKDPITVEINQIAVGDEPSENINVAEFRRSKARALISVDATAGVPLQAFGGEIITRTAQVAIQVVGIGGACDDQRNSFIGDRPLVDAVSDRLMKWLGNPADNGAAANVQRAIEYIVREKNKHRERQEVPPRLLSLVAQDATPDADENLERTVILVEAVTVPNP